MNIFPTSWKCFSDLLQIETALPQIKSVLPEIETTLAQDCVQDCGRAVSIYSRLEKYFQEVGKIFVLLVALNVQNWLGSASIYYYLSMVIIPK